MPFSLVPPRADRAELIDSLEPSETDFAASFEDVARVNRYLGGTRAVLTALPRLLDEIPVDRTVRILDIATGSADIPRALIRAARAGRFGTGRRLEITAVDNHPMVLALARRWTLPDLYPEIRVKEADAFALPSPDGAFDIALCSLAFHHFGYDRCVFLLREMERLTIHGFIVNDLVRDRVACSLIWVLTRLVGANRLTRHDAPLSVLRAFTPTEYRQMLREAGIPDTECDVGVAPLYRAVTVRVKPVVGCAARVKDQ
jgi:ubiquinone/menaquinone biosynthesis C-methylase UbiE